MRSTNLRGQFVTLVKQFLTQLFPLARQLFINFGKPAFNLFDKVLYIGTGFFAISGAIFFLGLNLFAKLVDLTARIGVESFQALLKFARNTIEILRDAPLQQVVEFRQVGEMILEVLDGLAKNGIDGNEAVEKSVAARVTELCARFPIYQDLV